MPFPLGWPPRPATSVRSLRFYVTGTATANFRDNAFLFRDANKALTVLGTTLNGRVLVNYDTAGLIGNSINIEVVVPLTGGPLPLAATIANNLITVRLAIDASNGLVAASNTATLVAAAVNALAGITAVATGTGAESLGAPEEVTPLHFGGAMPVIPTPRVPRGGASTRAVAGDSVITGSPQGGGANLDPITQIHHWSHTIRIVNTGAAIMTYSFDGINIHGTIPALVPEVIMRYRYEAGIAVAGSAAFVVDAW